MDVETTKTRQEGMLQARSFFERLGATREEAQEHAINVVTTMLHAHKEHTLAAMMRAVGFTDDDILIDLKHYALAHKMPGSYLWDSVCRAGITPDERTLVACMYEADNTSDGFNDIPF